MIMQLDPAQLRASLARLITDVHAIHGGASSDLRLADLAVLLHLPLNAEMQRLLNERGSVSFHPAGGDSGRFENRGTELKVQTPSATIVFPPLVAGNYTTSPEKLDIRFDPASTILGKKMMLSAPMESLHLDLNQLIVKVGGPLGPLLSRTVKLDPINPIS
jgi:hypothetical protein